MTHCFFSPSPSFPTDSVAAGAFAVLVLFCGAVCAPHTARAQSEGTEARSEDGFAEASLVTSDGDTLRGQVHWPTGGATPDSVRFRPDPDGDVTLYGPAAVRAVRTSDGRRLVGRTAQLDQVPTNPRTAAAYLQTNQEKVAARPVLLEVVVEGPLPFYTIQGRRNRYFTTRDGDVVELIQRRRYIESRNAVSTSRPFRSQLRVRMQDCPAVAEDAGSVRLQLGPVKDLVTRYNDCVGPGSSFVQADQSQFATTFGVVGGITQSQFSMGRSGTPQYALGWGTGFRLGIAVTVRLLRTDKHWGAHAELSGLTQRIESSAGPDGRSFVGGRLGPSDYVEMQWIKFMLLPRYYFRSAGWSPYVELGGSLGYRLGFDSQLPSDVETLASFTDLTTYTESRSRVPFGVAAGTGVQYGGLQIGLRAERTSLWTSYANLKPRIINVSLHVGYEF